jgi:hypothetical protein
MQGTGQRVQFLTFNGSIRVNTRWKINTSNGVPTLVKIKGQELSGNTSSDFLGPRDDSSINNNGHFSVSTT